ncbi:MAG TPA: FAD-binding oxidoreductase, partial [Aquihabitans sp.]|nr:FAD-binding oxidoreductase [Aquihabitans sp.]
MSATETPVVLSATRRSLAGGVDVEALRAELERTVEGEVRFDDQARGAYATDASNYRQVPIGVVVPASVDDAVAALGVCRRRSVPVVSRGGGTSLAGECTNVAVVVDWSRHCHGLLSVDPEARTCVVEPGIVLDHLNERLAEHHLEFGPRPATHSHCTLGGMIGNNSCGATAQRTGKVVDNVRRLEVLLADGTRCWVGPLADDELNERCARDDAEGRLLRELRAIRDRHGDQIRDRFPDIPRRVSGYNLDALLPEQGFDVAKLVVGSEGTLATVLAAELQLVPTLRRTSLVVLGYPDIATAADAVPGVLAAEPTALEAIDRKLVSFERTRSLNPDALDLLPDAGAWLVVQGGGDSREEADAAGDRILEAAGRQRDDDGVAWFDDPRKEQELWRVRESALGATSRLPGHSDAWPGWEDSAVHPDRLGDYLRDLRGLLDEFGYGEASLYGHFGQGCVHCRIPFELTTAPGVAAFRRFVERAAELVAAHGGSLSGEHGDGQARGELLPTMFGDEVVEAFGACKAAFDPDDLLNPGKVVDPFPLDADLRLGADFEHRSGPTWFRYP